MSTVSRPDGHAAARVLPTGDGDEYEEREDADVAEDEVVDCRREGKTMSPRSTAAVGRPGAAEPDRHDQRAARP